MFIGKLVKLKMICLFYCNNFLQYFERVLTREIGPIVIMKFFVTELKMGTILLDLNFSGKIPLFTLGETRRGDSQDRTARMGQPGQDSWGKGRSAGVGQLGQLGQVSLGRSARAGQLGQVTCCKSTGTGQPGQASQARSAWPGQTEKGRLERLAWTGQPK